MIKVLFVGDIMLSDAQNGKHTQMSHRLKNKLTSVDIRVATLETAVGTYDEIDDVKCSKSEVAVWSKQSDLNILDNLKINVVSLANNHACDCGVDAMLRLKESLHQLGIQTIGAGRNIDEAMEPAVFCKEGETLAIIGVCEDNVKSLGTLRYASETEGGIYRLDRNTITSHIRVLKQRFSYVAVVVHWGVEHKWLPEMYDVEMGKAMIDAGADAIIGGHPHHIQPQTTYKNRPIYYSLGNFHFPDFCLDSVSNVYYPDDEALKRLPVFDWMAPDKRNFAMLYFWKYYGRLGMIAEVHFRDGKIVANTTFTIYNKGKLSLSQRQISHRLKLKLFSHLVGKEKSKRFNYYITRIQHIIEYKFLALFVKKYNFFGYLKKQKSV